MTQSNGISLIDDPNYVLGMARKTLSLKHLLEPNIDLHHTAMVSS